MTSLNEFGRAATEVTTPPVDQQGASPASPSMNDNYPRPMGATPYTPHRDRDTLALVRDYDENATDGELDEWMSYRIRWQAYLAGGEA